MKKIIGIFICIFLIGFNISVLGNEDTSNFVSGKIFKQFPKEPGPWDAWWCIICDKELDCESYDDFWGIDYPINVVQWWGMSLEFPSEVNIDPNGMIFTISFYEDEDGEIGNHTVSYTDIEPTITSTNLYYDTEGNRPENLLLYHFKCNLETGLNMEKGWIKIERTSSDNDCAFYWLNSIFGNGWFYTDMDNYFDQIKKYPLDMSFILSNEISNIDINIKGGIGCTIDITNNNVDNINYAQYDVVVFGGLGQNINFHMNDEILSIADGESYAIKTDMVFGFGPISIGVIADDVVEYKSGIQLLIYTFIF